MRIGLVACSKSKAPARTEARLLYTGSLFRKAAAYCAREYDCWYILSAKYGLLRPDSLVDPYDETLVGRSGTFRRAWADRVVRQLGVACRDGATFYAHAGRAYVGPLAPRMDLVLPVAGLGIGQQLAWYKARGC